MKAYFMRDFSTACRLFSKVSEMFESIKKVRCSLHARHKLAKYQLASPVASIILAKRCEGFQKNPPPADWSGCDVLKSKEY